MDIEKYKKELEAAIYEGVDEKLYIGGKVVKKVLNEAVNEALRIHDVVGQSEQLVAIFEKMNRQHITMLEIGDYDKLAKEMLSI